MIQVEGLTRAYGHFIAVDDISFECKPGTVTGFLGPNGAGKTTTMRVMVGLTPATHGDVTIGGLHFHDIPNPGRHVGVLLDASAQHGGRTGRHGSNIVLAERQHAEVASQPIDQPAPLFAFWADRRIEHRPPRPRRGRGQPTRIWS